MVARTTKIMGTAYSTGSPVTVELEYNGSIVYTGTVPTITENPTPVTPPTDPYQELELASFITDTDTTGQIPCKITVTGGTLFFAHFWMNYTGNHTSTPNPNPPPAYIITPIPPIEYFADPNVNSLESDGLSNVRKNGLAWNWRRNVGDQLGDWVYPVHSNEIFEFDFFVDPARVVLNPYGSPN